MSQLTSRGLDNTSYAFVSDLGAGKHPSPLDISESYSPDLYLKVGLNFITRCMYKVIFEKFLKIS